MDGVLKIIIRTDIDSLGIDENTFWSMC